MTDFPTLHIGSRSIEITESDDIDDDRLGEAGYSDGTFNIAPDQPPRILLDTLIHETLHHFNFVNGWGTRLSDEDEEALVTVLAGQLAELFVRNPDFIRLLVKLAK